VVEWRNSQEWSARQGILRSLNCIGVAELFAMSDAEKWFQAVGLLPPRSKIV
jgi:hypothetical protein